MRREEIKRIVRRACKLQHFEAIFQPQQQNEAGNSSSEQKTHNHLTTTKTIDGELLQLEWRWGTRLTEADTAWVFDLFKRNMRELYLRSQWGYDEKSKREELTATTSRYLLIRNANALPIAYVHFRFVEDEGRPVLYCYEIQVESVYQRKGIGSLLIDQVERLAEGTQMELLMATVFAFNGLSLAFFHKHGFRTDSTCRFGHDGPDGRDYVILSKQIVQKENNATAEHHNGHEKEETGEQNS